MRIERTGAGLLVTRPWDVPATLVRCAFTGLAGWLLVELVALVVAPSSLHDLATRIGIFAVGGFVGTMAGLATASRQRMTVVGHRVVVETRAGTETTRQVLTLDGLAAVDVALVVRWRRYRSPRVGPPEYHADHLRLVYQPGAPVGEVRLAMKGSDDDLYQLAEALRAYALLGDGAGNVSEVETAQDRGPQASSTGTAPGTRSPARPGPPVRTE